MRPQPIPPKPGQESVWDYPRPPRLEDAGVHIVIRLAGTIVAETDDALRVLETSHPPTYYLPEAAFAAGALVPTEGASMCEWKGRAAYADVRALGHTVARAAWTYPTPNAGFERLRGHWAVMPGAPLHCTVDGEEVVPQEGGFYGGWITSTVVGPFKGGPGSMGW